MSKIIRVKDHYADVLLDDGRHVLISFTQDEVAVFQLFLGFPIKKLWSMERVSFEVNSKRNGHSALDAATFAAARAESVHDIPNVMSAIINSR